MKPVPNIPNCFTTENGVIHLNGKELAPRYREGYLDVYISGFGMIPVHRLVALAYIGYPDDPHKDQINHIDKNPSNNHYSNLEWVTNGENQIHASLFKENPSKDTIVAYTPELTPIRTYKNIHAAVKDLDRTIRDVWLAIKCNTLLAGVFLKHNAWSDKVPSNLKRNRMPNSSKGMRHIPSTEVFVRDLQTGSTLRFPSMGRAASELNVTRSRIFYAIKANDSRMLISKRWLIRRTKEALEMTIPNEWLTRIHGSQEVIAFNTRERKLYAFDSGKQFYSEQGLSKAAVTKRLRKSSKNLLPAVCGDWIFCYNLDGLEEPFREMVRQFST